MAKFGINDLIDIKKKESGSETVDEYKEIWLNPKDVKLSESNFYSQENIEELADSFLAVGQQQPTVLARVNGEFRIVSGHRRNLANIKNLERGYQEYGKVRYLYRDMTPAMPELSLLMGNAYNRELTGWEKIQQAKRLKEALIRAKKEDGLKIPGKLRDVVAELMNESSTNIARMECISNHAASEIGEEFKKGNLGISAAYEAAKLPLDEQREIAKQASEKGGITAKEVTERAMKKREGKDNRKEKGFSVVEKQDMKSLPQDEKQIPENDSVSKRESKETKQAVGGGNIRQFKKLNRHQEILREWGRERVSLTVISQAVADAKQKVSESDTSKEEWTDVEWAVFLTRAIMNQADCVSEEDLYLLHDIMIRCQGEE